MTPKGNLTYTLDQMWDKKGNPIEAALGSGWTAQIINPFKDIDREMLQFALVMKNVKQPIFS